jgi:hypothetical protein
MRTYALIYSRPSICIRINRTVLIDLEHRISAKLDCRPIPILILSREDQLTKQSENLFSNAFFFPSASIRLRREEMVDAPSTAEDTS